MLHIIKECKTPVMLILTPLLTGHKISSETRTTIKRNDVDYVWASWTGPKKHAANVQDGISAFHKEFRYLPQFIQIIDRDIILGRNMLDRLFSVLDKTGSDIAYSYCGFEYKGHINLKIPVCEFNIERLKQRNYISSNSLYKTSAIYKVGGFVVDEDTHRLSDWAMFCKLAINGMKGVFVPNGNFVAMSSATDISAGSDSEHYSARKLVIERFVSKLP